MKVLGVVTLLHVLLGFVVVGSDCQYTEEGISSAAAAPRSLTLFTQFPVHKKIAGAILSGDIDGAARLIANAVREGDGSSIVMGLAQARSSPGNQFSVIQAIVRALGLGVDGQELEEAVRNGSDEGPGAREVVEEVAVVIHGTPTHTPSPAPAFYSAPSHSWLPSHAVHTTTAPVHTSTPVHTSAPVQYIVQSGPPASTTEHYVITGIPQTIQVPQVQYTPAAATPQYVILDPMQSASGTYIDPSSVRTCRGEKEEQCCDEHVPHSPGCSCDTHNICRFKFIKGDPVLVHDTRRPGKDLCRCDNS